MRWALGYVASAWLVLELTGFVSDHFGWPAFVVRCLTVLIAFGLAAVLVVAWFHGERGEQRVRPLEVGLLSVVGLSAVLATFMVARSDVSAEGVAEAPAAAVDRASVAVLPFVNMSGSPDEEYFSDGVTEEILNAVAQIPELRVAARTSSFAFRGRDVDVREVGRQLGVAHVLEGSVRRSGDEVRITAQLIDARNGYHLWSRTFRREPTDVFALEDEISRAIANALELRIGRADLPSREGRVDPVAYDSYLRARQHWNERSSESLARAAELFEQAVAQDPGFAAAYSGLADTYALLEDYGGKPRAEVFPKAIAAARHALEIDENLSEAHTSLAHVRMHEFEWEEAERSYRRALELNPSYALAHHWYSIMLGWMGRTDEALRENALARRLDPLSVKYDEIRGLLLFWAGRHEEARAHLEGVVERSPERATSHHFLGQVYSQLGLHEEAIAAARRNADLWGSTAARIHEARVLAAAGRAAEARAIIEELRALGLEDDRFVAPYLPEVLVLLGEREEALRLLEELVRQRVGDLGTIHVDPVYDPLRSDRRFTRLLASLGIQEPDPQAIDATAR